MTARALLCLAAFALTTPAARAEPVYVVEQLIVNVVSEPGGEGTRVATVKSGERMELLDRQGGEAHVRLANGTEGWIRASYVSSEPPLQNRLTERTAEVEKLKQNVSRLETELAAARVAGTPAPATPTVKAPAAAAEPTPGGGPGEAGARPSAPAGPMQTAQQGARPTWQWVLGSSTVMVLVGFALGWRMLDRRIRRKYGGLRIY